MIQWYIQSDLCKRHEHTQIGCGKHEIAKVKIQEQALAQY